MDEVRRSNEGAYPLPQRPYGSLERLARILVDIARNPNIEEEPTSARDDL
jgi:hypothetical protein